MNDQTDSVANDIEQRAWAIAHKHCIEGFNFRVLDAVRTAINEGIAIGVAQERENTLHLARNCANAGCLSARMYLDEQDTP